MKPWPFDPLRPFSYDLAMIDPPWAWQAYSDEGLEKSPEAQYETMTMDDIAQLPVGDLVAPSGVLVMWGTWPLLYEQIGVLRRWGFKEKTGGSWAKRTTSGKLRWGTGYIIRSVCEPFIVATLPGADIRGGRRIPNLIETIEDMALDGLAREHSRKPDEMYSLLEALSPDARRCDIFSRQARPGWDVWGNESTKFNSAAA